MGCIHRFVFKCRTCPKAEVEHLDVLSALLVIGSSRPSHTDQLQPMSMRAKYSPSVIADLLSTSPDTASGINLAAARAIAKHGMHADNQHVVQAENSSLHHNYHSLLKECSNLETQDQFLTATWSDLLDAVQ